VTAWRVRPFTDADYTAYARIASIADGERIDASTARAADARWDRERYDRVEPRMPTILAFWHGQHFLTPFIKTKESHRAKVLVSRHRDGEYNAIAAERPAATGIALSTQSGTWYSPPNSSKNKMGSRSMRAISK